MQASDPGAQSGFAKVLFFMFFDMGLEGTGGLGWLSRVFRGPSRGLVIKTKKVGNQTKIVQRNDEHI
jgi:hypothetical protein